mmetsp:Transcript_586/g.828  ORF Transcript_586/g.828 Transcript_586/m.828 type:complete len:90 (+) Transcript_586:1264-1533(+)
MLGMAPTGVGAFTDVGTPLPPPTLPTFTPRLPTLPPPDTPVDKLPKLLVRSNREEDGTGPETDGDPPAEESNVWNDTLSFILKDFWNDH